MPHDPLRPRSRPAPVSGIVERLMQSLGLSRRYHGWQVVSEWDRIVGEHYARNSRAFRFEDGTLYVAVENDGWRQQMALDSEKIMALIHERPFGRVVKNLRLVRGEKGSPRYGNSGQDDHD